ncbi:hypothetical protein ACFP76_06525 [Paracoccus aerius]|uniref:hypothetical protein n=1 Tax=Paracoccus aerius TaxID=1915382 RepID=UPI003612F92F
MQRDQYGDHLTLVVGDDSPLEGKVPPGYNNFLPALDVYAPVGGTPAAVLAASTPGTPGGGWAMPFVPIFGGGGGSGGGRPPIEDTSSVPPEGGTPVTPGKPPVTPPTTTEPGKPQPPKEPWPPTTEQPVDPHLPPLQPVPLPDAAPLLIASLLAFAVLRRIAR